LRFRPAAQERDRATAPLISAKRSYLNDLVRVENNPVTVFMGQLNERNHPHSPRRDVSPLVSRRTLSLDDGRCVLVMAVLWHAFTYRCCVTGSPGVGGPVADARRDMIMSRSTSPTN